MKKGIKQTTKKTVNLFYSGVLMLTVANILVKIIGVFLKVPLSGIIGTNGMGYYSSAYDIYVWLYMVSTAGIPVAISIMISESRSKGNLREAKKIFRIALVSFIVIGTIGTGAMMGACKWFSSLYEMPHLYWSILTIAPTLLFVCVSCAIRGYFQGYQHMTPTAISEVIESLGKLIIGILLAIWSINHFAVGNLSFKFDDGWSIASLINETKDWQIGADIMYAKAAAFTILGLTIGVFISMCYLIVKKLVFKEEVFNREFEIADADKLPVRSTKRLLKTLLIIAIPVTISASMMSFANMLDGMIIGNRLASFGYGERVISGIIGAFKTQVVTFFNLPPALIYPISGSLVPYISTVRTTGTKEQLHKIMNSSVKVTSLIALPCALGMSVLSKPIIQLLFSMSNNPVEMTFDTDILLSVQSIAVFFVAMLAITNSFLQSYKYQWYPIYSIIAGCVVKMLSSLFLIGQENIQILGAPIGTLLCYATIVIMNFFFVAKKIGFIPSIVDTFLRPLMAAIVCAAAALGSYKLISAYIKSSLTVLVAIGVGGLFYIAAIFLFRAITEEDLKIIPKGDKLIRILKKLRLIR
ncbi:MAG: polysaccharide biosynthesis protein [Clostridia bacterium]|nr:polysaccharide biosynthesis protein [Clostridia bacterium]